MKVIEVRNVHQALVRGVELLQQHGTSQGSRNGPAQVAPGPVTTVYQRPTERLVFWPERDVNTAFLVYEGLWMLAGRRDVAPLTRYIKDFGRFSDDGMTLHGAYGWRWRHHFRLHGGTLADINGDQLAIIAARLRADPRDRRCVLQMWDAPHDLGVDSQDIPCNDLAMVQRTVYGALDMTVCCRSNDIIWGAYFANAYHFSLLQEYLARVIGCEVGTYRQVSVNYHAYLDTLPQVADLPSRTRGLFSVPVQLDDPYRDGRVRVVPMPTTDMATLDRTIAALLSEADEGYVSGSEGPDPDTESWAYSQMLVLRAHHEWRTQPAPDRYARALAVMAEPAFADVDVVTSMREWVLRRHQAYQARFLRAQDDGVNYEGAAV